MIRDSKDPNTTATLMAWENWWTLVVTLTMMARKGTQVNLANEKLGVWNSEERHGLEINI